MTEEMGLRTFSKTDKTDIDDADVTFWCRVFQIGEAATWVLCCII